MDVPMAQLKSSNNDKHVSKMKSGNEETWNADRQIPLLLYSGSGKTRKSWQVIFIISISCKSIAHN